MKNLLAVVLVISYVNNIDSAAPKPKEQVQLKSQAPEEEVATLKALLAAATKENDALQKQVASLTQQVVQLKQNQKPVHNGLNLQGYHD